MTTTHPPIHSISLGPRTRSTVRSIARFVMPRTFGENAAWYLNVLAAGGAVVTYLGTDYTLVEPEVIDYATAAPAFPRYERLQFRLIGINEYLRLRIA